MTTEAMAMDRKTMYCVDGVIFSQAQELEWRVGNLNEIWVLRKEKNHAFWHRPKNVHYIQESTYTQRLMKNVGITQDFLSKTEVVVQYAYHSTGLTVTFHLSYAHCPLPVFLSTVPYLVLLSGGNINSQHTSRVSWSLVLDTVVKEVSLMLELLSPWASVWL